MNMSSMGMRRLALDMEVEVERVALMARASWCVVE